MTKLQQEGGVQASLAVRGGLHADDAAYHGQAEFTPRFLAHVYNPLVVTCANRFVWRCPSSNIIRLYDEHVADVHLDAGPGTGWFLERCHFPSRTPSITLLDVNADVLDAATARLAHYGPRRYQANLLEPLDADVGSFDSIALTHVLHCLPGTLDEKAKILDHLAALLRPGGWLFGSTVVNDGVPHTPASRALLRFLNGRRRFSNMDDSVTGLERVLAERFADYELDTKGAVALFAARA